MKKEIIVFIVSIVIVLCIVICIIFKNKDTNCDDISGGSFDLILNTNSDEQKIYLNVCIACPPEAYDDLPILKRDGYKFDGWYYDSKLTKKVNVTNTVNISPVPDRNRKGCLIGYKDINLYAKWIKVR